jgi:hypothetical protein
MIALNFATHSLQMNVLNWARRLAPESLGRTPADGRTCVEGPLAAYRASDILTAVTKMRMTGPGPVPCTGAPFPRDK